MQLLDELKMLGDVEFAAIYSAVTGESDRRKAAAIPDDLTICKVEDGAMVECPLWEDHKRGKNWMATIKADPAAPAGLHRDFVPRGRGRYYYLVAGLHVGQAIEIGADYYACSGNKSSNRWYGVVVLVSDFAVTLRETRTAKAAIKTAVAMLVEVPVC